jgi:hypothetical protein
VVNQPANLKQAKVHAEIARQDRKVLQLNSFVKPAAAWGAPVRANSFQTEIPNRTTHPAAADR